MVTVKGDTLLDEFRHHLIEVVDKYSGRGLSFGYPSGGIQTYRDPSQVPIPVRLMGNFLGDYLKELGDELGVVFESDKIYGKAHHRGVKKLSNSSGQYTKFL